MKFTLLLLVGGIALNAFGHPDQPPANPKASPAAQAVLKFIQGLQNRPDKKLLSGQFTDFGTNAGNSAKIFELIQQRTGCCPAILGVDYADWHDGSIAAAAPNAAALNQWRHGGLVTINVHFFNPLRTNLAVSGLRDKNVDITPLLDPTSPAHAVWMRELDDIAIGLQQLRDAGVVVLWRPFHEMNGGWFWWGAKKPAVFIQLWRQMFDYFTIQKKLNNLLWVYAANTGGRTADYYPGDGYVDLVGVDAYTDFVDAQHIQGVPELLHLPKPFGFTEFGPHGPFHPPGDYNYLRFIDGVEKHFPEASFFQAWSVNWGLTTNQNVSALLHHPWVVNRAGLPDFLDFKP
jgi:mannan endo-1,4-beta-mannosidase